MPPKGKQRSKPEKQDSSSGESFENITLASALDSAIQDGAGGEATTVPDAVQEPAPVEPTAAASAAAEAAARASGAAAGEDSQADPMRELEEATARAAEQAMVAARQAAKGLSAAGGWLSGLVKSGLQAVQAEMPSSPSAAQEAEGLRRQLGLPEGEAVLESFSCQVRRPSPSALGTWLVASQRHSSCFRSCSKPTSLGTMPSRPPGSWHIRATCISRATTSAL